MARRIVDLSVVTEGGIPTDPPFMLPTITYMDHRAGAQQVVQMFPGLSPEALPGGEGWAIEMIQLSTHTGTHMDAPYHYRSEMNNGEPSSTIDEVSLDWCIGPGVKLDFRHLPDGHVLTPEEIDQEPKRINHTLAPGDIVLLNTSAATEYSKGDYMDRGCGVGRAGKLHLTSQGIRVVGTDAWSWDAPFRYTRERFDRDHDVSIIWEGHFTGSEIPYCQIEKLTNLESRPPTGFTVISLPVKVHKASGGWARPIAVIED